MHQRFMPALLPQAYVPTNAKLFYISHIDQADRGFRRGIHSHRHITEVTLILAGTGRFFAGEDQVTIQANDLVVVPAGQVHAEGHCLPSLCVGIVGLEYNKALTSQFVANPVLHCAPAEAAALRRTIMAAYELLATRNAGLAAFANDLIVNAVLNTVIRDARRQPAGQGTGESSARRIKQFLDGHYGEPIGIADVSRQLNMSRTYLDQQFSDRYGMTPINYLIAHRIGEAQTRLIIDKTTPVIEIASTVGFRSEPYFSRVFKTFTGISPLKYRQIYREIGPYQLERAGWWR